jgi:myo-inositol-1(or 4)-monophosphatase
MTIDLARASRAAEQAAYAAGTHLQASRSRLTAALVTQRDPDEVAAEIDRQTLALIREVVLKAFPDHGFVGEESGFDEAWALHETQALWIVDALDGRINYQRGYPHYAVSIALVVEGEPRIGVVYDPGRNEFFGAIRGHGAVLNGERIECAWPRAPADALAATVFPKPGHPRMGAYLGEFGRVVRGFGGVRRSGSMALEMAYLAAGRIDAFWEHDMGVWDAAAGLLLLRESGVHVEARDARPLLLSRSLFACVPGLREPLLRLLNGT